MVAKPHEGSSDMVFTNVLGARARERLPQCVTRARGVTRSEELVREEGEIRTAWRGAVQHLERNRAVVLRVLGQVDGGHAATPQLALQGVLRAECRLELLPHVRRCHRRAAEVRVLEATAAPCTVLARPKAISLV